MEYPKNNWTGFLGRVKMSGRVRRYSLSPWNTYGLIGWFGCCSGFARAYLTGKYNAVETDSDCIAWGYSGTGPLYCASAIIYSVTVGFSEQPPPYWRKFTPKEKVLVKRFMKEVVAKLPLEWQMSVDEVQQWINNGRLPSAAQQTNNKPKETNDSVIHQDQGHAVAEG